jgi:hypothetical protein
LSDQAVELRLSLEQQAVTNDSIVHAIADLYRNAHAIVDSVTDLSSDGFWISWTRSGSIIHEFIDCSGVGDDSLKPGEAIRQALPYRLAFISTSLTKGHLLILTKGGLISSPPGTPERAALLQEIARAQHASDDDLKTWTSEYLNRHAAEEFRHPRSLNAVTSK